MASIASVYVDILPVTGKIAAGIEKAFREVDPIAREAGKRWAKEIDAGLAGKHEITISADTTKAKAEIDEAAKDRTSKVKVEVDKDSLKKATSEVESAFGDLGSSLGGLGKFGAVALSPNIVPLIGSVVQAATQLSGVLGLLPAVAGSAGLAIGSLKIATDGFGQAIKDVGDTKKFNDDLKQLAPSAQGAAKAIQGLMPQINILKVTVQDAFFKGFGDQITALGTTYVPVFRTAMSQIAASANTALTGISKMLQTPELQADIRAFTSNAAVGFNTLSGALQPVIHAFTEVATIGSSFLPKLAGIITDAANAFDRFVTNAAQTGKLAEWIQGGITAFGQLKDIVVNVYEIFSGLFTAADGGGKGFLQTVDDITRKMSDWLNSSAGQAQMKQFFVEARQLADQVLQVLTWIGSKFLEYPSLINVAAAGFAVFQTAKVLGSINSVFNALGGIGKALGLLPGEATTAATGMATAFQSALGPIVAVLQSVGLGNNIANGIDGGNRGTWDLPDIPKQASRTWGEITGTLDPTTGKPYPSDSAKNAARAPGQNPDIPATDAVPGTVVPSNTPGAIPAPGKNYYIIPSLNKDPHSTNGFSWGAPPAGPSPTGSSDPQAGANLGPPVVPAVPGDSGNGSPVPPVVDPGAGYGNTGSGGGGGGGSSSNVPVGSLNWDALADKESGGNWSINTGNGYSGGIQFDQATWDAYKAPGDPAQAWQASKAAQIAAGERLYAKRGTAPWPKNGHLLTDQPGDGMSAPDTAFVSPGAGGSSVPGVSPRSYGGGGQEYGLPAGTNTGGYGSGGAGQFPAWVQQFGGQFGTTPSTYPGHQETDRHEAGFAPNPNHENRGIDWTGTPAQMQAMVDYLIAHPQLVEQLIYKSPTTGQEYGIAGGKVVNAQQYYGEATLDEHGNHVHTRFSKAPGSDSGGDSGLNSDGTMQTPTPKAGEGKSKGSDFGKDFLSGMAEVFGFDGSLFKSPTDFGITKLLAGFSKVKFRSKDDNSGGGGGFFGDTDTTSSGDGGAAGDTGGGSVFGSLLGSLLPGVFGPNQTTGAGAGVDANGIPLPPAPPAPPGSPASGMGSGPAPGPAGPTTNNTTHIQNQTIVAPGPTPASTSSARMQMPSLPG